ncbi:MAG: hypothetical protein U9N81_14155 [Bacillota bacterium]|nr:hypothetical protein [Bacillota bacterium]
MTQLKSPAISKLGTLPAIYWAVSVAAFRRIGRRNMDIRMSKTQQNVSGGFRSKDGCDAFDIHRSYIATAIKHEISVLMP